MFINNIRIKVNGQHDFKRFSTTNIFSTDEMYLNK